MNIERAIEILNPEHREHYESIEPVNEACRMGMDALKKTNTKKSSKRQNNNRERLLPHLSSLCSTALR